MIFSSLRRKEKERFFFFFVLAALLSLGQTLGLIGSETLVLCTFGAAILPKAFVIASLATVIFSLIYAYGVDIARNDNYFVRILLLFVFALACCALYLTVLSPSSTSVLIALYCLYYASFAICTNHFWTFTGDFFDTLSSKRLFPLLSVGSSLGGLLGGALASLLSRIPGGPIVLIWSWAFSSLAAALWIAAYRRRLRRWGPLEIEEADETSFEGLKSSLRYLHTSRFGRLLVLSSLFLVTSLFISQYLYSTLFISAYPDPEKLATFLGIFLALANALELALELKLTPLLLGKTGVANSNLVHPSLTAMGFILLGITPNLCSAVIARLNRETVDNALGAPVRNLIYNALPARLRGRIRAFLEGIVIYSGMAMAGMILLLWESFGPHGYGLNTTLCAIGLLLSLGFWATNFKVKKEYVDALVTGIRTGRIDLSSSSSALDGLPAQRLVELWRALVQEDSRAQVLEEVGRALAQGNLLAPLEQAFQEGSPRVRLASLQAMLASPTSRVEQILSVAIADADPQIRLQALKHASAAAAEYAASLLNDADSDVRAEAAIKCRPIHENTLIDMLTSNDSRQIRAALLRLPPTLTAYAQQNLTSKDEGLVQACLIALRRQQSIPPLQELLKLFLTKSIEVQIEIIKSIASSGQAMSCQQIEVLFHQGLANQNHRIRRAAINSLIGLAADLRPQLEEAASLANLNLCQSALEVLGHLPLEATKEFIVQESIKRAQKAWMYSLEAAELELEEATSTQALAITHKFLTLALKDSAQRELSAYFRLLELLEEPKIVRSIEKVLRFARARIRADALEVLSNLGVREASLLLVHVLEEGSLIERNGDVGKLAPARRDRQTMLDELPSSNDRWLQLAAGLILDDKSSPFPGGLKDKREANTLVEHLIMLQKIPLFSGMTLEQLDAIHRCLCEQQYTKGELIFGEGDIGDEMFIILEGEVEILIKLDSDHPFLLSTIGSGAYFGEMSILDDEPRSAAARVSENARVLVLKGEQLKDLIFNMPELAFTIFKVLSARQRRSDKRLNELTKEQQNTFAAH